ncbi:MAG: phosphate ABC transporter permease PstA [Eubacteriales bacterium]|nr:phosphate ABC transporter permease PstA [Eubacteriales bacterium]MDD3882986.1 phosphate ABC transporter permease PstA [Eubacteriales bacterium]MDD4513466.1 phosphate ABC transporter permease PstA [Eubacteriales bacterium]
MKKKLSAARLYIRRHPFSALTRAACTLSIAVAMFMLLYMVGDILIQGVPSLRLSLFEPVYTSDNQSMLPAIVNTLLITVMALLFAVPLGVFGAVYLSEYAKRDSFIVKLVRVTAETLSGIPSILYGLFGMMFYVGALKLGLSLVSGALTLGIMVLPLVLRTAEEALLAVPDSYREGSFGLGAGRLRTVMKIVLPPASSGILAGVMLSVGRIIGETAALIFTAGTFSQLPKNLLSSGRTLSVHMYVLSGEGLHIGEAYATAVVLLVLAASMNALSSALLKRLQGGQG